MSWPARQDSNPRPELEAPGFLQITPAAQDKMPWTGGIAVAS